MFVPVPKKVNLNFFKKWNSLMAYVCGFFAADGNMTFNERGAYYWSIQIKDEILLRKIRHAVSSNHKISIREKTNDFGTKKRVYRMQIGSKEMCEDLRSLGFSERKTFNMTLPKIPEKYLSHFVRGYFDGDGNVWTGYVHKDRATPLLAIQTVFTSCSNNFLEGLRIRLEQSGIGNCVVRKGKGNYYRLTYSILSSLKLYNFMYNHGVIMETLHPYLERKKIVFDDYIAMRP